MQLVAGLVVIAVVGLVLFQLRPSPEGVESAILSKPLVAPVISVLLASAIAAALMLLIGGLF